MKDFNVTITLTVPITAKNLDQAQERADIIEHELILPNKKWFNDYEIENAVSKDEQAKWRQAISEIKADLAKEELRTTHDAVIDLYDALAPVASVGAAQLRHVGKMLDYYKHVFEGDMMFSDMALIAELVKNLADWKKKHGG